MGRLIVVVIFILGIFGLSALATNWQASNAATSLEASLSYETVLRVLNSNKTEVYRALIDLGKGQTAYSYYFVYQEGNTRYILDISTWTTAQSRVQLFQNAPQSGKEFAMYMKSVFDATRITMKDVPQDLLLKLTTAASWQQLLTSMGAFTSLGRSLVTPLFIILPADALPMYLDGEGMQTFSPDSNDTLISEKASEAVALMP